MLILKEKEVPNDLKRFFKPAGWAQVVNCAIVNWDEGCHVCRMVLVCRELRRVLRDDGTFWLNYGSSYGPNGQMIWVPALIALALQADGWILRQDIIWHKPSPMPESVTNRCTKAHEYVFLLTKRPQYFYDAEAIKEKGTNEYRPIQLTTGIARNKGGKPTGNENGETLIRGYFSNKRSVWSINDEAQLRNWLEENCPTALEAFLVELEEGNKSDIWRVSSQGYEGAHFATFPPKLIEPMILAGTSAKGCCIKCGAPWKRVIETRQLIRERPNDYVKRVPEHEKKQNTPGLRTDWTKSTLYAVGIHPGETKKAEKLNTCSNSVAGVSTKTVRWEPTCSCWGTFLERKIVIKGQAVCDGAQSGGIPNGWNLNAGNHGSGSEYQQEGIAVEDKAEQRERAVVLSGKERTVTVREFRCGTCGVVWSRGEMGTVGKDWNAKKRREETETERGQSSEDREDNEESLSSADELGIEIGGGCSCLDDKIIPCTILDPFLGSGTSCAVAIGLGLRSIGIDLSRKYLLRNAIPRIEGELLERGSLAGLIPRAEDGIRAEVRGRVMKRK